MLSYCMCIPVDCEGGGCVADERPTLVHATSLKNQTILVQTLRESHLLEIMASTTESCASSPVATFSQQK